ncbi:hypothetical protein C8R44DRAFT_741563 [Mycena epipterygia]|nr:hypothetical protein C8R44DRAFT_741563 [Mycena epipterygia]
MVTNVNQGNFWDEMWELQNEIDNRGMSQAQMNENAPQLLAGWKGVRECSQKCKKKTEGRESNSSQQTNDKPERSDTHLLGPWKISGRWKPEDRLMAQPDLVQSWTLCTEKLKASRGPCELPSAAQQDYNHIGDCREYKSVCLVWRAQRKFWACSTNYPDCKK